MRREIRIAGSGGQGVILGGVLLAYAIGLYEGLEVAQTQSYGPEARGGACQAGVVVSDEPIDYVKVDVPDELIILNEAAFRKYAPLAGERALILVDSTLVDVPGDFARNIHALPATRLAEDTLQRFVANMVLLGAFSKVSNIVSLDSLIKAVVDVVPPRFCDVNIQALRLGNERMRD
jgi:2-oxoglutarate ferredoxin oxidoreductase subunit gamma